MMEIQIVKEDTMCSTHNAMFSCLETVVNGIHEDLLSLDGEVNNLVVQGYNALETCLTPHFFTNPKRDTKNFAKLLEILSHSHDHENQCGSCVKFSRSAVFLQKEIDCYVQFVDFIIEKFSAVSRNSSGSNVTPSSRNLKSTASIRRSMIRTNPNTPVFPNLADSCDKSSRSLDSLESVNKSSHSNQNCSVGQTFIINNRQSENCECCTRCRSLVEKFSNSVDGKLNYIQVQCNSLKTRVEVKLEERESDLQNLLQKVQRSRKVVSEKCDNLNELSKQCNDMFNGVGKMKIYDNHLSSFLNGQDEVTRKHSVDSDYGSGTCDQDICKQRIPSDSSENQSHDNNSTNQRLPSASSSEGSYTLPIIPEHSNGSASANDSKKDDLDIPVFVSKTDLHGNSVLSKDNGQLKTNVQEHDLPLKRSSSFMQINTNFDRESFRRRSHTVSNPARNSWHCPMNDSGPYMAIPEISVLSNQLNSIDECKGTVGNTKPGKIKKSKSSILVRANRLKNFLTKKLKRKSWGGAAHEKQISPTSVQASSTGVQFFEYDFSDDGQDKSMNITSDRLGELSELLDVSQYTDTFCETKEKSLEGSVSKDSSGVHDSWICKKIAEIEKHLGDAERRQSTSQDSQSGKVTKGEYAYPHTKKNSKKMLLPSRPVAVGDRYFGDMFLARSPMESLLEISDIEPVRPCDFSSEDITSINHTNISYSSTTKSDSVESHRNTSRRRLDFHGDGASISSNGSHSTGCHSNNSKSSVNDEASSSNKSSHSTSCHSNHSNKSVSSGENSVLYQGVLPVSREEADGQESECSSVVRSSTVIFPEPYLKKLWHLKPYLLLGTLTSSYLLYLVENYPRNIREIPGYCSRTKEVSGMLVAHIAKRTNNPQIFARNLVWHIFTLLELYGGKTMTGQSTDSLDMDRILAVRNATSRNYQISNDTWHLRCVPFIHQSINVLFNQKLRLPVFRALFQHSDC